MNIEMHLKLKHIIIKILLDRRHWVCVETIQIKILRFRKIIDEIIKILRFRKIIDEIIKILRSRKIIDEIIKILRSRKIIDERKIYFNIAKNYRDLKISKNNRRKKKNKNFFNQFYLICDHKNWICQSICNRFFSSRRILISLSERSLRTVSM